MTATIGLLKAHVTLDVVARNVPVKYRVFPTNDERHAVAYHIAGSLWGVVGDAATEAGAQTLCEKMNRDEGYLANP